jgi:hypothetical protein
MGKKRWKSRVFAANPGVFPIYRVFQRDARRRRKSRRSAHHTPVFFY